MAVIIPAQKVPGTAMRLLSCTYPLHEDKSLAGHKLTILDEAACSQLEHTMSARRRA